MKLFWLKGLQDSWVESNFTAGFRSFQRGTAGLCKSKGCRATGCQS